MIEVVLDDLFYEIGVRIKYATLPVLKRKSPMKLHGIFIGVDTFGDARIPALKYAAADAREMHAIFQKSLRPEECCLKLLCNEQANQAAVRDAIGEDLARQVQPEDSVVIYFSGHGCPESQGSPDTTSRYLVLYDTLYDRIFRSAIEMEREMIQMCFGRIKARLVVLMADTCFSGMLGGKTFKGPQLKDSPFRPAVHLNKLDLGEGRLVLAASKDDQLARETGEFGHGIFTHYLIQTLTHPGGAEQTVSVPVLATIVARKVYAYTARQQTPTLHGSAALAELPYLEPYR